MTERIKIAVQTPEGVKIMTKPPQRREIILIKEVPTAVEEPVEIQQTLRFKFYGNYYYCPICGTRFPLFEPEEEHI